MLSPTLHQLILRSNTRFPPLSTLRFPFMKTRTPKIKLRNRGLEFCIPCIFPGIYVFLLYVQLQTSKYLKILITSLTCGMGISMRLWIGSARTHGATLHNTRSWLLPAMPSQGAMAHRIRAAAFSILQCWNVRVWAESADLRLPFWNSDGHCANALRRTGLIL